MNNQASFNRPAQDTTLRGFQRKFLRGLAHGMRPTVLVGGGGITEAVVEAADRALLDHELIKVRMRQPDDKKAMATELATRTGAHLCGLVGHMAILYKAHPQRPRLALPSPSTSSSIRHASRGATPSSSCLNKT